MLSRITPPTTLIMPLDEAKAHLQLNSNQHDGAVITALMAAVEHIESMTERALVTQVWELWLPALPVASIRIPRPPLQSITSIKYVDSAGTLQTISSTLYNVVAPQGPTAPKGRAEILNGVWPAARTQHDAYRIRFVAGYGGPEHCPEPLRQAVKLILGDLFENREATLISTTASLNPTLDLLLNHYVDRSL